MLETLNKKIGNLIDRFKITSIDDSKAVQSAQITQYDDETINNVPVVSQYGFSSRPDNLADCEAVVFSPDGSKENGFISSIIDIKNRFKNLKKGQTVVYADKDSYIIIDKKGNLNVKSKKFVAVSSPEVKITGKEVSINSESDELISVLIELVRALKETSKTNTIFGPMNLVDSKFDTVITSLETFTKTKSKSTSQDKNLINIDNTSLGTMAKSIEDNLKLAEGKSLAATAKAIADGVILGITTDAKVKDHSTIVFSSK